MLTKKDFTKKYFDSLKISFPNAELSVIDENTIELSFKENDIRISIDNAYIEYKSKESLLDEILKRYISSVSEIFNSNHKTNINRILPIIKPIEYLNDVENETKAFGATKSIQVAYEKYNDQLIIVYAEDTDNSIRYLTQDDLKDIIINPDDLQTIAIKNLDRLLTSIQKKGNEGVYMLIAGSNYESSIILLKDIVNKQNFEVDGDLVIAIPNRDMLLITGSNNKEGIKKITRLATKTFQTGDRPLSQYLYKWNGYQFKKFK